MHGSKAKIGLIVCAILVFVILCEAAVAIPMPPHKFYGNVTMEGEPAPDGMVVSARIEGREYANMTVMTGKYGFDEPFYVPSDDLDTVDEKEGGGNGDVVELYVNNELAANATFSFGGISKLDLKIGEEPEQEPEKPVATKGFLMPLTIAIIIVLLVAVIVVLIIRRRKG